MSGIYIKGMEMPKSCHECVAGYGGCCYVAPPEADGICPDDGRANFCPLVPVPPHGRLIDEKDVLTKCGYIIADGMACIPVKYIANASTVIEAEEGEA